MRRSNRSPGGPRRREPRSTSGRARGEIPEFHSRLQLPARSTSPGPGFAECRRDRRDAKHKGAVGVAILSIAQESGDPRKAHAREHVSLAVVSRMKVLC